MCKYLLFILSFLLSCSLNPIKDDGIESVDFGTTGLSSFPDSLKCVFIPLETRDDCLISGIEQAEFVEDKIYLIDSRLEKVLVFDISGKFITQIGNRGSGPGEYIMPSNIFIDKDKKQIYVTDRRLNKMLCYDLYTYKYNSIKYIPEYTDCARLLNGDIAWFKLSGYADYKRKYSYLKISDFDLKHDECYLPTTYRPEYSISIGKRFHKYADQTYLSIQFLPIVYKITEDSAVPAYKLSFGDDLLPSHEWLDEHMKTNVNYLESLLKSDYISAYNLEETNNYWGVTYYSSNRMFNIAFCKKKDKIAFQSNAFEFMKKYDLYGMSPLRGTFDDYFIVTLNMSDLKRYTLKSAQLKMIVDKVTIEDNPILCLFKFDQDE